MAEIINPHLNTSSIGYVPQWFANPSINTIALNFIPGIFYVIASYGHIFVKNLSFTYSLIFSIFFAIVEYAFRVPINQYAAAVAGMSDGTMQVIYSFITLLLSYLTNPLFHAFV